MLQLLFLGQGQACGELDFDTYNEIASFCWLLALWHTEVWVLFSPCRSRGSTAAYIELFAIDCLDGSPPACEGFFEVEFDDVLDVVAFAGEEWVDFLDCC